MDGTLLDLLEQQAAEHRDKALYSFFDRRLSVSQTLSFESLYLRSRRFAGVLQHAHCDARPVLLYCPHGPGFLIAFFACVMAGAWPVPVTRHRAQSDTGLALLLRASGADTVVTTDSRLAHLPPALSKSGVHVLSVDAATGQCHSYQRPVLASDDTAFIQYTSGSTSSPKGVMISHANVLHNAGTICRAFACGSDDIGVSWLPFHHDMGLIGHIITPLYVGLHNYFLSPLDFVARPVRWLQAIAKAGATLSGGPDFAFALAAQKTPDASLPELPLNTWRLAYCGAEKIRPQTLDVFVERFSPCGFRQSSLFPCYGLAEATLFVSGQHGVMTRAPAGAGNTMPAVCLGKPAADTTVQIVNPDTGCPVSDSDSGEICVSSASVAKGYYRNPVASSKVFGTTGTTGRQYCRTGDRGFLHDQRLYLLGRFKNVFKRHGCSFHAEDLEAALQQGLGTALIGRCAAFSTGDEDADKLVVMLERNRDRGNTTSVADRYLITRAGALMSDEFGLVVDDVRVLPADSLPLTSSGKIRRGACPGLYRQQVSKALGVCDAQ